VRQQSVIFTQDTDTFIIYGHGGCEQYQSTDGLKTQVGWFDLRAGGPPGAEYAFIFIKLNGQPSAMATVMMTAPQIPYYYYYYYYYLYQKASAYGSRVGWTLAILFITAFHIIKMF